MQQRIKKNCHFFKSLVCRWSIANTISSVSIITKNTISATTTTTSIIIITSFASNINMNAIITAATTTFSEEVWGVFQCELESRL